MLPGLALPLLLLDRLEFTVGDHFLDISALLQWPVSL